MVICWKELVLPGIDATLESTLVLPFVALIQDVANEAAASDILCRLFMRPMAAITEGFGQFLSHGFDRRSEILEASRYLVSGIPVPRGSRWKENAKTSLGTYG